MYIAVCDDEKECRDNIEKHLTKLKRIYKIKYESFRSAEELLEFYKENGNIFDVLITDIEMQDMNGIELANIVRERDKGVVIFFLTSHTEYAIQCFRPEPMDFWVKPVDFDTVKSDIKRAYEKIDQSVQSIKITEKRTSIRLRYNDIIYLEKLDRKTLIHTKEKTYITNKLLSEYCRQLRSDMFVRIYQSYIVNVEYIKVLKDEEVELYEVNRKLPVGRTYASDLRDIFINFKERSAFGD